MARHHQHEEIANSLTHGLGLVLSLAGFAVLLILAAWRGSALHIVSCAIYGSTLVCLYAASTVYHSVRSTRLKHIFKVFDHSCIYLLIAGTYTPFTLINLRGSRGWTLFGLVWGLAVAGVLFKLWEVDHFQLASTAVYLLMGWIGVIALKPLLVAIHPGGVALLLAGGLFYTIGVAFYGWHKLPYNHAVWHVFVLAGSICHFLTVFFYVLPAKS